MLSHIADVILVATLAAVRCADTSCEHPYCQDHSDHSSMLQLRHDAFRHSTHECHGGDSPVPHKRLEQTCLFQNVCLMPHPKHPKFLYFTAGTKLQEEQKFDGLFGDNGFVDGRLSVNIRPMGSPVNISFEMVSIPFPERATRVGAEVSVLFQPVYAANFGHHIGDNMFAIYTMLTHFHVKDLFGSQLLTWKDCDENNEGADGGAPVDIKISNMSSCAKIMSKLYASVSRHPIKTLLSHPNSKLDAFNTESDLLCFPNLIAGAGPLHIWGRKELLSQGWWSYRSYMLGNLGVKSATILDRIVLSKKGSSCHSNWEAISLYMGNVDQVASRLKSKWPKHNVTAIDFATVSLYDQAKILADTFALVTHPGGGSFVGFFLPPGATIILLTQQNGKRFVPAQEPAIWTNMYWIQTRFIPINESSKEVDPVSTSLLVEEAFKHELEFTSKGKVFAW